MARESIYKKYKPANIPKDLTNTSSYWFIFKYYEMLVKITDASINIPYGKLKELKIIPIRTQYLGTLEGKPCYSAEVDPKTEAPEGMEFRDLRSLYNVLDEDIFLLAGKAVQMVGWDRDHQYCGRCGAATETSTYEMAKVCPECGFKSFVRLSPAVITAIVKDGKLLMAKHGYRGGMYGLIAGFVEPGETLEEAVERETMEEVGLRVKNIKYFGSQSWPFPHSLMVGFTAEHESGGINVDGKEITDAEWFSPDEIPRTPSKISIASELIEWFILKFGK
jgi:NAD+ diphosphatase